MKVYTEGLTGDEAGCVKHIVTTTNSHPDTISCEQYAKKLNHGFYPAKIKKGRSLKRYVKIKPRWVMV